MKPPQNQDHSMIPPQNRHGPSIIPQNQNHTGYIKSPVNQPQFRDSYYMASEQRQQERLRKRIRRKRRELEELEIVHQNNEMQTPEYLSSLSRMCDDLIGDSKKLKDQLENLQQRDPNTITGGIDPGISASHGAIDRTLPNEAPQRDVASDTSHMQSFGC